MAVRAVVVQDLHEVGLVLARRCKATFVEPVSDVDHHSLARSMHGAAFRHREVDA
jgi:hypothetical protein